MLAIQGRMAQRHGGDRKTVQAGNISGLKESGDSRDIAARAAGLGSGKTLEAAQRVAEHGLSRRHRHVGTGPVPWPALQPALPSCRPTPEVPTG